MVVFFVVGVFLLLYWGLGATNSVGLLEQQLVLPSVFPLGLCVEVLDSSTSLLARGLLLLLRRRAMLRLRLLRRRWLYRS